MGELKELNLRIDFMDTESDLEESDPDSENDGLELDSFGSNSESDSHKDHQKTFKMRMKHSIVNGSQFHIPKSSDLKSNRLHSITTELFELREKGGVVSQRKLDKITKHYYLHFKQTGHLNMACLMKLFQFKNLYFRKDYEKGITLLKRLDKRMNGMPMKDEPFIRGKLHFNLAYAYHALKKTELARQSLERAKHQLQFTEGGEDKADLYYFEGKLMDFYVQKFKANNPLICDYRARAVKAYRMSRDNVLLDGNDDYLKQRAMYRSLAICKVYLDYPDLDSCQNRSIVTLQDTKEADQLLKEIESHDSLSPRLKSRFSIASAELHFRKYQLHLRNCNNGMALEEIHNAYELATSVSNELKDTLFVEKQISEKMSKYYEPLREKLETQFRATAIKTNLASPTTESAKETKGEQNSKMTPSTKYVKDFLKNLNMRAQYELMDIKTGSSGLSSCETWLTTDNTDRESDCMI